ncbi:hypothetical protein F8M41_021149 [Gigaspora margarita]|uniref:Uncharacterized protein n=1 Tax=Gigaspora margarita TaxID=4874 RepID=A0A8H4AH87_GIGMA|nr:hypothetical protein F8M41_021149 [Gigaspora margarita]
MMSEISTLVEPDLSNTQNVLGNHLHIPKNPLARNEKTGGKKISSMLKKLIEELLTDIPVPIAGENLDKASENGRFRNLI